MISKKAFTLTEILTTVAITGVVFGGVSMGLGGISSSSDIFSVEQVFTSKIRSEKVSAISGEINCSKTELSYEKNFFKIFHGVEKNFSCEKKIFGNIKNKNKKIFIDFNEDLKNIEIQIFKNGGRGGEIIFKKESKNKISFDLKNEFTYKIVAQKGEIIEETEIIFFNNNPLELEEIDIKTILVDKLYGKNFKKEKVSGNTISIVFINSNPKSKIFLKGYEINNANISFKTMEGKANNFDFFSANLLGNKKGVNISDILK